MVSIFYHHFNHTKSLFIVIVFCVVPNSAPKVHIDVISSTKLNVTWKPLTKKEARGVIVEYKLQWRLHEHPSSRVISLPAHVEYYTLAGN